MKRTILFSGGMDSVALALRYPDAQLVYVRIGSSYEQRELDHCLHASSLSGRLVTVDCGRWLGDMASENAHVPNRNLFMAVAAASLTGCDAVLLGATAGELSPDKSRKFVRAASRALSQSSGRRCVLLTPLRSYTKGAIVREVLRRHGRESLEFRELLGSPCCYEGFVRDGFKGCGRCNSCRRRWAAFYVNGISERYEFPPWETDTVSHDWRQRLFSAPVREWISCLRPSLEYLHASMAARREHR